MVYVWLLAWVQVECVYDTDNDVHTISPRPFIGSIHSLRYSLQDAM